MGRPRAHIAKPGVLNRSSPEQVYTPSPFCVAFWELGGLGGSVSERGRLVYALLRSLLAWAPGVRSGSGGESGFVSGVRLCLNCRAVGRWSGELGRRVAVGCPHCGG